MHSDLQQQWLQTASTYSQAESLKTQLWKELEKAYSAKSRHYHNLHHLETMLHLAGKHRQQLTHVNALSFAIFYHDAVYSTSSKVNEEKSAELAQSRLQTLGVPPEEVALVREMILATKNHQAHTTSDVNWLLDFDLAVLGAPWEKYLQYSQQIRKEYHLYPDFLYNPGRMKVLQHFLEKEHLYQTSFFQAEYESSARRNLEKELALLASS